MYLQINLHRHSMRQKMYHITGMIDSIGPWKVWILKIEGMTLWMGLAMEFPKIFIFVRTEIKITWSAFYARDHSNVHFTLNSCVDWSTRYGVN